MINQHLSWFPIDSLQDSQHMDAILSKISIRLHHSFVQNPEMPICFLQSKTHMPYNGLPFRLYLYLSSDLIFSTLYWSNFTPTAPTSQETSASSSPFGKLHHLCQSLVQIFFSVRHTSHIYLSFFLFSFFPI